MTKQILKVVALGVLGGLAIYAFPFFLLKAVFLILLAGFIFRMMAHRRMAGRHFGPGFAFAGGGNMKQRFQQMSEEERKEFFAGMKGRGCGFPAKDPSTNPEPENK